MKLLTHPHSTPLQHGLGRARRTLASLVRLLADAAVVAVLWFLLLIGLGGAWKDAMLWAESTLKQDDSPAYRSVFIGIDQAFLQPDLPLTLHFQPWAELLDRIRLASPAVVLVDFQFSAQRYESLLPGGADVFEKSVQALSESTALVMGVSPAGPKANWTGRVLQGCMLLVPDRDGVIRDHYSRLENECPESADSTLAAVAAKALGKAAGESGLVLTRGQQSALHLSARDVIEGRAPLADLKGSILVVGLDFPLEDEFQTSHAVQKLVVHPPVKGALIHALNTEAVLEGRVAWRGPEPVLNGLLFAAALLALWCLQARKAACVLLAAGVVLMMVDLAAVIQFRTHLNGFVPAALCLSAFIMVQLRNTVAELLLKRRIQGLLGGLLSPAVLKQCLADPVEFFQARRFENAAVLVLDLQGYTAAFSQKSLQEMHEYGNHFLGACAALVHARGGSVERFRGDGLLAYFGAPLPSASPVDDALACALEILDLVRHTDSPVLAQFQGRIRFGLSCGEVILGRVGSNDRFDLAVTGLAANRAAHFESLADPVQYPVVVDAGSLEKASQRPAVKYLQQQHPKHPGLELQGAGRQEY